MLVHATLSSLGLSTILKSSPQLYSAVKYAGTGYLLFLGAKILYEAARETLQDFNATKSEAASQKSLVSEFRAGLLSNVLNPKVAVFYITFLSQFVDPSHNIFVQSILLTGGHILMSIIWLLLIGVFVGYFKPQLEKPKVRRAIEAITGFALIGFGLRLAF